MESKGIKKEIKNLGWKVKYVSPGMIKKYLACYNVRYKGKRIRPKAAIKLKIPLNEIWISEKLKSKAGKILHHELQEIHYRRMGYSGKIAHKKAQKENDYYG